MAYADLQGLHNPATNTAPPATWGDQARDNDEYLYARGPYICTSGTRPASPFDGQMIYETDTNKLRQYDGSNWWTVGITGNNATSFYPGVTQSVAVSTSAASGSYTIINGVCEMWWTETVSSAGTAGNQVQLTLPVTSAITTVGTTVGNGMIYDASAPRIYPGQWEIVSSTRISLATGDPTGGTSNAPWGATPNIALASGDLIRGHVRFLVASAA